MDKGYLTPLEMAQTTITDVCENCPVSIKINHRAQAQIFTPDLVKCCKYKNQQKYLRMRLIDRGNGPEYSVTQVIGGNEFEPVFVDQEILPAFAKRFSDD